MAKTEDDKKIVYVEKYRRQDGTVVPQHYRSTPCPPPPPPAKKGK